MNLTPREKDKLLISLAAMVARGRLQRGVKLNHPESIALITDFVMEGARDGRSVADLISFGSTLLTTDDVMPGVADLMPMLQVEGMFPDGTKLVTVHDPIRPGRQTLAPSDVRKPGEILPMDGEIELHAGRERASVTVLNTGDRPIQIGSHYHFFEVNKALDFDRAIAFGMHLDIPAGTAVRFEPGESRRVNLVAIGGAGEVYGLNGLTNGSVRSAEVKEAALNRARQRAFKGA